MNPNITIYTKSNCPNCVQAKQLMKSKGLTYLEVDMDDDQIAEMFRNTYPELRQMPQIWINAQRVGGIDGLRAALNQLGL